MELCSRRGTSQPVPGFWPQLPSVPGGAGVVPQQLQNLPWVADGPTCQQEEQPGVAPVDGLADDPLQRG